MLPREFLFGPGVVPGNPPLYLIRIGGVVTKDSSKLSLAEPVICAAKADNITVKAFVGSDDLPDIKASTGENGPTTGRAISKEDARTPAYLNGFGQ